MTGRNIYTALYVVVSLLCVFISVYLSYYGYYSHLDELTIFFAVLIGLLLFSADLVIRHHRIERKALLWPMLLFFLIAIISTASNFNFLYTNFMSYNMAERFLKEEVNTFRDNLTDTKTVLTALPPYQEGNETRNRLDVELDNLKEQLNDPLRPGCGERCRDHVENINTLLGGAPTDLAIPEPSANETTTQNWYRNYRQVTTNNLSTRLAEGKYGAIDSVINRINKLLSNYESTEVVLETAVEKEALQFAKGEGLSVVDKMQSESLEIQREANALLPTNRHVDHARIQADLDTIGEIPLSIKDGFVDMPKPAVTAMSLFLGVFVDIIPVLFALVIFGPDSPGADRQSQRKGRKGRRVAT